MATLPYDTDKLIKETQAMLAQTQAEGGKAYAGSSFQVAPAAQQAVQPSVQQAITPADLDPVQPTPFKTYNKNLEFGNVPAIDWTQYMVPAQEISPEEKQRDADYLAGRNTYQNLLQQLSGEGDDRSRLMTEQDIGGKSQVVQDLTGQMRQLQAESQAAPIQAISEGQGRMSTDMIGLKGQEAQRQIAVRALTTGAQLQAAQGNLSLAMDMVDKSIKAKYDPIREQIAIQRDNLDLILRDPRATRAEKERAEQRQVALDQFEKQQEVDRQNETRLADARIKAITANAGNPNFDSLDIAAINAAKSAEEVAAVLAYRGLSMERGAQFELSPGQTRYDAYGNIIASRPERVTSTGATVSAVASTGDPARDAENIMNGSLNLSDTSTARNYRGTVAAELAKLQKNALSQGDFAGVMAASAAYDKEVSDTFLQSMEKTLSVVSQLETLQQTISQEPTGPLVGAFRSANPWDTKAQVIKAELNAIVPNLARGVYGEVGVLTDNDIKQYAKTIPTLTSTEDIRNAILYITLDQIRKNVQIKIQNQVAGQRDMSGYADTYRALNQSVDGVLRMLPKNQSTTKTTGTTPSGISWTIEK